MRRRGCFPFEKKESRKPFFPPSSTASSGDEEGEMFKLHLCLDPLWPAAALKPPFAPLTLRLQRGCVGSKRAEGISLYYLPHKPPVDCPLSSLFLKREGERVRRDLHTETRIEIGFHPPPPISRHILWSISCAEIGRVFFFILGSKFQSVGLGPCVQ